MNAYIRLPQAIFDRFVAGDSIEETAFDFGLSAEECTRLLRIQCKILQIGKSKAKLNQLLGKFVRGNHPQSSYEVLGFAMSYAHQYNLPLPDWVRKEYISVCQQLLKL